MRPRIRQVLLDFDGVLARYDHGRRLAALAAHAGCTAARVHEVLFESGLETAYDCGEVDTAGYLGRLGEALACKLSDSARDARSLRRVLARYGLD